jgi:hypothetical protein
MGYDWIRETTLRAPALCFELAVGIPHFGPIVSGPERIRTVSTVKAVAEIVAITYKRIIPIVPKHLVRSPTPGHAVIPVAPKHRVGSVASPKIVSIPFSTQVVIAPTTFQVVAPGPSIEFICFGSAGVIRSMTVPPIISRATIDDIAAAVSFNDIEPIVPRQVVIPIVTSNYIAPVTPIDIVVAAGTGEVVASVITAKGIISLPTIKVIGVGVIRYSKRIIAPKLVISVPRRKGVFPAMAPAPDRLGKTDAKETVVPTVHVDFNSDDVRKWLERVIHRHVRHKNLTLNLFNPDVVIKAVARKT